ncbi:MAG: aminopeptidase P N-terminal domain-containing protein [Bacteroidia bacterium]|nr:aminopeptidase P N-terminal domain-containing protein [Bacteroidia bacterium]
MKYTSPPPSVFQAHREQFILKMQPGCAAVFFSNDLVVTNGDGHYPFIQESNLYYLTGIDQEDTILFLFHDSPRPQFREVLFIRRTNQEIKIWEGEKLTKEQASAISGIETVMYTDEFENFFLTQVYLIQGLYLYFNEHDRNRLFYPTASHRFAYKLQQQFPALKIERAAPILYALRMIKSEEEIEQIKRAISITAQAFERVAKFVKPGVYEYEIEAEIIHEFIRNRSRRPAYEPIVASGANACVLHYIANNKQCKEGDLVLLDFGAEYGNYASDLTRTIPVNGKFTPRQKEVYMAVCRVFEYAKSLLIPGNQLETYTQEVGAFMQEELKQLGLLTEKDIQNASPSSPAYKKYFPHGVSHHLGLVTHDNSLRFTPFAPGMVLTCEPGIYIPEEGIGIRLENDILITENGPQDLMEMIPMHWEAIENLMNT